MIQSILLFTSSVLNIFLGFYVLANGFKKFLNKIFFLFCLNVAGWIFSIFFLINFSQNIIWGQLPFIFASFVFYFLLIFSLALGKDSKANKIYSTLLIIPPVLLSCFTFLGMIIKSVVVKNGFVINTFGPLYSLFSLYVIVYLFAVLAVLVYKYKVNVGNEKMKIRYIFLGILCFVVPASITNMVLPSFFNLWQLNGLGPFFSIFMILAISYAILRYHLMDVWFVLRLGMIFTLSLGSIIFFFISVNYLLVSFFQIEKPLDVIIPSFFITIGFIPLKKFVEYITDEMFFRRHYKFNEVVQKIEKEIHSAGLDLDKSLSVVNQAISNALKVDRSVIMILIPRGHFISRQIIGDEINNLELHHSNPIINYLNSFPGQILDREEIERNSGINGLSDISRQEIVNEMKRISISLVVPIEFKEKLIGVYLLGAKMSEDPFNSEDLRLLQHVAWEMSFAIDNARSYEELKHLDDAKSNFIQVVSHQMRTPVTITRCNLELALDKDLSLEEKEGVLKAAYEGVSSLGHQLDQLLTVLEIEEKEMIVRKEPVDLNLLINGFVEDNRISIKNKKLKLEMNLLDSASSVIDCDEKRIRRVLDIILLNAINYTPSGGKITVSTSANGFNSKNSLIVSVTDNGVGINDADKVNLFKKFFRSPEAISMFPNGFGLGLFIARKIVRAHGGDIWFDGRDHEGMTFSFSIPFKNSGIDKK